jgi:hypothetical protein
MLKGFVRQSLGMAGENKKAIAAKSALATLC